MNTCAHEFFRVHVIPNLQTWQNQSIDIRLAMNAVVSLYHMADHYWYAYSQLDSTRIFNTRSSGKYREELAERCNWFKVLRDVAEAHKHMKLTRSSRVLTQANQTEIRKTGFGEGKYSSGSWGGTDSIVIELDDGKIFHLNEIIENVKQFWESNLR